MPQEKKKALIKKVDALSKSLGFGENDKTLFEIKKTDDPKIKELHLQSGSWDSDDAWFAIDEEDTKKAYAFIPSDSFAQMLKVFKQAQKENFDLKLEKTIWQNIPNDFDDVWVVAMDEIKNLAQNEGNKPVSIDLEKLISDIKENYPNLFINMKDFYPNQLENHQGTS
ncbi:MAG TPA: DUF2603 domain-containing protein [Campylobacterales bacterium]|nr:DUF2603 domain-containing protein [Campylobacterales bacterium]